MVDEIKIKVSLKTKKGVRKTNINLSNLHNYKLSKSKKFFIRKTKKEKKTSIKKPSKKSKKDTIKNLEKIQKNFDKQYKRYKDYLAHNRDEEKAFKKTKKTKPTDHILTIFECLCKVSDRLKVHLYGVKNASIKDFIEYHEHDYPDHELIEYNVHSKKVIKPI